MNLELGRKKIKWVEKYMKVVNYLRDMYINEKPFNGVKVAMSIHLEAKTAYLATILKQLGADVAITGSNPLTTQPEVAEALKEYGIHVYAEKTLDEDIYWKNMDKVLEFNPNIIIDDGADLGIRLIEKFPEKIENLWGICEETTTGVKRYKALYNDGKLSVPLIAINDSYMKYLFDNRYGTGQSTWDGIIRSTNITVTGKNVVVGGYGWCGRGIAMRAKGLGANVIITEIDPIKANEAIMDGFRVMKMNEACKIGDIFVTATGDIDIITEKQFLNMKDGVILANSGHFDVEVKVADLEKIKVEKKEVRPGVEEYVLPNGKSVFLLGKGRLVNLTNADGHPIEIMDLSFALQLEGAKYIMENYKNMDISIKPIPYDIDKKVASIKLKTIGIEIDTLSEDQKNYLNSWK
ncbi:adenosylhomocysteinase [Tepiditoga spiralis]|uniref:Adenosylhomocysteinase n=1 Tax=Tepiditoga spiralis TaxID=2108365 RepID=A0A7G1G4T9_9BACT|nr:adenosylhomocysteinase [Tepiditoga spiralis]BBE31558.1 adenosylhomocysteinase [Tepiditoga spiralis]